MERAADTAAFGYDLPTMTRTTYNATWILRLLPRNFMKKLVLGWKLTELNMNLMQQIRVMSQWK